jgi:hypothetical protein
VLPVEADIEELAVRSLQPAQVEVEAAGTPVSNLHRGEVTRPRLHGRHDLDIDRSAIDLRTGKDVAHEAKLAKRTAG